MRIYTDDKKLIEIEESDRDCSLISMNVFSGEGFCEVDSCITMTTSDAVSVATALLNADIWARSRGSNHG